MGVSAWIRDRRGALGWSQGRLAEAVGASQPTVSLWERGKAEPPPEVLERLKKVLGAVPGAPKRASEPKAATRPTQGRRAKPGLPPSPATPIAVATDENQTLEKRLWAAADELRANSNLNASQYSAPVLGLIFLKHADHRFTVAQSELAAKGTGRRSPGKLDYQAQGVLYLPEEARFSHLLQLAEGKDIGSAINEAMKAIERENEDLRGVLPQNYNRLENATLVALLKNFNSIPVHVEGDAFGKIYEYFLGKFAMSEGRKGGEFFTPTALVKLIVEVIEPYHGRIFDPACGSGGMFVQSARFVENHRANPSAEIMVYGEERVAETIRLCTMNLAVHGLAGEILQGNTYYEDRHEAVGKFDFVMANPPFNVDKVDKDRIKSNTARFPFGMPAADNANYLWIQLFYSSLNEKGRAGFVMANSASDARGSELEIRKKLLQAGTVDVMIAVGPNFFYTVTLPCTLWFLDRGKAATARRDQVLFVDARHLFRQLDRAHRDFAPEQIEQIAELVRAYRGGTHRDVPGLCKAATLAEIEAQGWSLNPGRYVGVAEQEADEFDFFERFEELTEELEALNAEGRALEERIAENAALLLAEEP